MDLASVQKNPVTMRFPPKTGDVNGSDEETEKLASSAATEKVPLALQVHQHLEMSPSKQLSLPLCSGVTCKTHLGCEITQQFGWLIRTIFIQPRDRYFQSLKECLENRESHLEPFSLFYREAKAAADGYLNQL